VLASPGERVMDFRILGPLEVLDDGQVLDLRAQKQRALLAVLLLHAGEVVSADRLIEALWEEGPPDTAHKGLQVYVSQLRKLLGKERIETREPGYLLHVHEGELDLARFQELAGEDKLEQALDLWRGSPLPEFAYRRFAQAEIGRLEELRLACLEQRIARDLASGCHAELVAELEALVTAQPLRERLRSQLMLALYRSGRQAEALEAYQDARRALTEELGIDPGKDLRELHRAMLRQDPALDLAPAEPTDPAREIFVGRDAELKQLLKGLEDVFSGRGRLFLLVGEPGIGKSRLADEVIRHARARGARTLIGRCWEAGGAPAYWPWLQAIGGYVRELGAETLRAQLGPQSAELVQFLPDLRELSIDVPEPPSQDAEGARFRLFHAVASFLKTASQSQPLVLALDDLHAADAPSLLLLQFLARELAESRLLVVGAYRDVDPTVREPLDAVLPELAREPVTAQIALEGLSEHDVADYIEASAGITPAAELVIAIHSETEGSPLFVTEIVRLLAAEGQLTAQGVHLRIPPGVRAVIDRRVGRLSEQCRGALAVAAVFGREFGLEPLARLVEQPPVELLRMLDEAIAERVVGEVPGAPGRLRFAHAVIRDALYDSLTPSQRLQLHRKAGEALEAAYASDLESHLTELTHHFFAATPSGEKEKAHDYARRAGDRAASLLAYEEAARLYEMALTLSPTDAVRCDLMLALGDAHARAGDESRAKETFLGAAEVARRAQAPDQLVRAALGYGGRFVWARAGTDAHLVPLLEEALAALGGDDSELRVRVLARLAGALRDQVDRGPRARLSEKAVEMARRIGDTATLAYALDGRCMATFWPENTEDRIALATEFMELADEIGDRERATAACYYRMMFQLELGDISVVEAGLDAYQLRASELRQPAQLWLLLVTRATLALFQGRFEEAEGLIPEALARGQGAQRSDATLSYRIQRFTLARERGGLEAIEPELIASVKEYPARPMFRCMLAALDADLSREQQAHEALDELAADDFAVLPLTNEWLFSLGFLAEVAAAVGDSDRAEALYQRLLPYASRNACTADYIATGSVSRNLGLLAAVLSRWDDAEQHFELALTMNQRMGARPWVAHTQEDYARMLLARDGPGDSERAGMLLKQAVSGYRELGMQAALASTVAPSGH
jgi:predicted ATPase/DNA-binding SARP family transcriptional activator